MKRTLGDIILVTVGILLLIAMLVDLATHPVSTDPVNGPVPSPAPGVQQR